MNNEIWSADRIKELTMEKLPKKSVQYNKMLRRASVIAGVAAAVAMSGIGVYAAFTYLSPSEVANELNYPEVAKQFEIQTSLTQGAETDTTGGVEASAIAAEPVSITSGDYTFTLLGVTSGADLTVMREDAEAGRTYAVVAIENADGTPFDSETYYEPGNEGIHGFFVSPLIHGREPWKGGAIVQLGGGATERIIDGKIYRLINCDNIEIFAKTGVSLAVSTGSFYNTQAFDYNAETGLTTAKDFDGSSAVFELPLDPALGDSEKAAAYWENFEKEATATAPPTAPDLPFLGDDFAAADWEDVTIVPGTTQILTRDDNGAVTYKFDEIEGIGSGDITARLVDLLRSGNGNTSWIVAGGEMVNDDGSFSLYGVRFTLNTTDGSVTAELVIPNNLP
ncbi:MAG: hypothetical protein LBM59_01110 [Ruminococcus sp.]|jgi:hypothetical protein|nr:hypothetical protein [Ruminococcus sp.]